MRLFHPVTQRSAQPSDNLFFTIGNSLMARTGFAPLGRFSRIHPMPMQTGIRKKPTAIENGAHKPLTCTPRRITPRNCKMPSPPTMAPNSDARSCAVRHSGQRGILIVNSCHRNRLPSWSQFPANNASILAPSSPGLSSQNQQVPNSALLFTISRVPFIRDCADSLTAIGAMAWSNA